MSENELPYSYHTFLFPFIWKTDEVDMWEDFTKVLSIGTRWFEDSWNKEQIPDGKTQDEWMLNYAAFQYFTDAANHLIFNTRDDDKTVHRLSYRPNGNQVADGKYVITKGGVTYALKINSIRMQAYDVGVAVLILELENYDNPSIDAVNAINEYGRRINFPFLPENPSKFFINAESIEIFFDGESVSCEDYKKTLEKINEDSSCLDEHMSLSFIMKPIQFLLDNVDKKNNSKNENGYEITSNYSHYKFDTKKYYYIKPCIDDRMFVCCLVRDEELSQELKLYNAEKGKYKYLADCSLTDQFGYASEDTFSDEIYKLCYIETSLSCPCAEMKEEILRKSVYPRWIDYGTIHAVTHHSMVCLTGSSPYIVASVINPFLTEYVQIAVLTLVQRAAILMLSNEASDVATGFSDDKPITSGEISRIEKLQQKYVKMQSQLLLSEITVQEQGVEIYELMREQLYINHNKQELDEQMSNLRDVADIANARLERQRDDEENKSEKEFNATFTIVGFGLALLAILEPLAGWCALEESRGYYFCWMLLDLILIALIVIPMRETLSRHIKQIFKKEKTEPNAEKEQSDEKNRNR